MLKLHRCVESSFIFDFDCGQGILSTLNTLIVYCFSSFLGKTLVCRICIQSDHSNVQFTSPFSQLQYSYSYLQVSWKVRDRYCYGRRQWRLGPAVRKNWRVGFHFHSLYYKFHFKRCNVIVGSHSYLIRVISLLQRKDPCRGWSATDHRKSRVLLLRHRILQFSSLWRWKSPCEADYWHGHAH